MLIGFPSPTDDYVMLTLTPGNSLNDISKQSYDSDVVLYAVMEITTKFDSGDILLVPLDGLGIYH